MTKVISLTGRIFGLKVLKSSKLTIVKFWAPWCGYCKQMEPVYDALSVELSNTVDFYQVNADDEVELAKEWKIDVLPTFMVFKDSKLIARAIGGMTPEDLRKLIEDRI
jgi:thioredoxin 1